MDTSDKSETWKRGYMARARVLGEEYVENAFNNADDFTRDLQDYVTEHAWGASWAREGLEFKTRSMINLAMISALNRPHELEIHLRGALRNGVTRAEIKEILLQVAVYCGAPAALDSFRVARKVLAEVDRASAEASPKG
jgi:4-carboxymuconolactone decarboxylase